MKIKKSELKKILKPIVQECIRESILEDGVLSTIIAEVMRGTATRTLVESAPAPRPQPTQSSNSAFLKQQLNEIGNAGYSNISVPEPPTPKKMIGGIDVFANTEPIVEGSNKGGALSGISPNDPGVNIDALANAMAGKWKILTEAK
tara:strand:+ start:530 stop:967 length:438 start_codon:yes stop_codon:yes gene_type:complete